jgi:hypothetical protein
VERLEMLHARRRREASEQLTLLVEELLGALDDAARLAADTCVDWRWQVQLGYLRDLERLGHETLALVAADTPCTRPPLTVQSSVPRRGPRRCARNGHGEGPA